MNTKCKNHCIECTVVSCANHSQTENYCALDKINIGTQESHPTDVRCTNCNSFVPKSEG
ncbi:MAG: DUF1540 domain-containing protein [Clostridia bacterium]|nr:DUF1540 domain-containing protein [Oscillospiraceae bacterium]MBQ6702241.1 DUF1540 domain-containing protein [Clostridia bacterium]